MEANISQVNERSISIFHVIEWDVQDERTQSNISFHECQVSE